MPQNWEITTVEGDLVFFEWLYQYNFASDNDLLSLTATGTTTTITSGENAGMDLVSLSNMGKLYDLIMVGGDYYDANYINQTLALYDNDTLEAVGSFEGHTGSAWGGSNLLWNQAEIQNIGAGTWSSGLPEHYTKAMASLDSGKMSMPVAFSGDHAFEGTAGLRVLYVKGNLFDLNYIEQKTIVSDSDKLAVYAKDVATKAVDWSISTGNNALVNAAGILDYDSNGNTAFVGGTTYSTAMLIQSNIIDTGSGYSWSAGAPFVPRGDALASEVIAFLHDDLDPASDLSDPTPVGAMAAGPTLDVMDHVLA